MNILILSNSAPDYFYFFNRLAEKLSADGHLVEIAVDSPYTRDTNRVDTLGLPVHEFAAFWDEFQEDPMEVLAEYADLPLNSTLHSDFERAEVLGFDKGRDQTYYQSLQAALLRFFDRIMTGAQIDLVIYENVSNTFAHIAWLVTRRLHVGYCGLIASRLPGRFAISDDPLKEGALYQPILEAIQSGQRMVPDEVRKWSNSYLEQLDQTVPDYMKYNKLDRQGLLHLYARRSKLQRLRLAWRHRNDNHRLAFQVGNPLKLTWRMFWRSFRRRIRAKGCAQVFSAPVPGERFLLYPVQFHPESSTSINAAAYHDEYEVIRNIAFSLPVGTWLYVKDHISAFAYPPVDFYRRVAALPNVRFIEPSSPTKRLIRESVGVITLTSTMGYEALLLNRRVFLYGSVFFEFHPNVVKVENPARLFELFREHLDAPLPVGPEFQSDFVSAYFLGTYAGILNFFMGEQKVRALVDEIYPQLLEVFHARARTDMANGGQVRA